MKTAGVGSCTRPPKFVSVIAHRENYIHEIHLDETLMLKTRKKSSKEP
jgi:hypothetical protein